MPSLDHLSPEHRRALDEAVRYVRERYEPWAILAAGSIVRGDPDANSDIDLYVLHDARYRQRVQRRFHGVPVEIFVNPESSVLEYMRTEARTGRMFTAHMISTGVALLGEEEPRLSPLREVAERSVSTPPPWSELDLVRARYGAATTVEDAIDLREADPESAMRLLGMAMNEMISYAFKRAGKPIPRRKEVLPRLEDLDPVVGALCRRFWSDSDLDDRWEAAMAAADHTLETRYFFEWESEQEPVTD